MEAGDTPQHDIELTFCAVNDERDRQMYNTTIKLFLPPIIKPYDAYLFDGFRVTIVPPTTVRRDDYIKWEHIEQYDLELSLGDGIPYHKGWWCTVHAHGVKPGTGEVTAKLSWEDKEDNKYSRVFLLKTVTVIGKEEPSIPSRPNQGPKVKVIIFDKSPGKVKFYMDADDREGDEIAGCRWKIDGQGWSDWMDESVITVDGLAAGKHTIFAQAKDDKRNEGKIAKKKEKIEGKEKNYGPSVIIPKLDPFPKSFQLQATDPEGDEITSYRWRIDERPRTSWGDGIVTTEHLPLIPGEHTFYAQAKDDKGNMGKEEEQKFEIKKKQGPNVTIDGPHPNPDDPYTVRFRLIRKYGEGDEIAGYYYRWSFDKQPLSGWGDGTIITERLTPGKYTIYAQAKDDKGNEGEVAQKEFVIGQLGANTGINLVRGEIAPWGSDIGHLYGIGWGYEVYGEYRFHSRFSFGASLGFQQYDAKQKDKGYFKIVPLYVRVAYHLFKRPDRRFQLKPFLGVGLNLYRFAGLTDYDDTTAYGIETGLIMEYALNSPTSPNKASFVLQSGVNYTHSDFQSTFTPIMLGMKFRL